MTMAAATSGTGTTGTTGTNNVVREARYVLTNIASNNNKFWNIRLFSDGGCETHWGRVGEDGQHKTFAVYTEHAFDAKCREKEGKGYKPQKTLGGGLSSGKQTNNERLMEAAAAQIETDSAETLKLITYLARVNVHRILEATTLQYDTSRGTFSTPLGIVTKDALSEARDLLVQIGALVHNDDWDNDGFLGLLNEYLMLIPQNIGRAKLEPRTLFPDLASVQRQNGILDALEASLQQVLTTPITPEGETVAPPPTPKLFEAKLKQVDDPAEIERIRRKYQETQQNQHACAHLEVRRVFQVEVASMAKAFQETGARVGSVQELWHGTRAGNLLSILKGGFVIPPSNAPHCTGRMFGNGVYFSDQSTKSLNYAYGYWSGTREETCFMFLCDVAMGKSYTPPGPSSSLPLTGYDSTFAQAGKSGVGNNEMIVYATDRINPRYLVEFGPVAK